MTGNGWRDPVLNEQLWYRPVEIPFEGTDCDYMGKGPTILLTTDDSLDLNEVEAVKRIAPVLIDCYQMSGKLMARTMAKAIMAMWMTIGSASYERLALHDYPSKKPQTYNTDRWLKVYDPRSAYAYVHVRYSDANAMWQSEFFYEARGYNDLEIEQPRFTIEIGQRHAMRADYGHLIERTNRIGQQLDTSWPEPLVI